MESFARSAKPPQAMASDTAAKASWNRKKREMGMSAAKALLKESAAFSPEGSKKNPPSPINSLPFPKVSPKPRAQNASVQSPKVSTVFPATWPAFFIRVEPASKRAKPACIKITSMAATMTHVASIAEAREANVGSILSTPFMSVYLTLYICVRLYDIRKKNAIRLF